MQFKWRKWNRVIHRDLGYFFFVLTVVYSLSGIAVNHIHDWNPNYRITHQWVQMDLPRERGLINTSVIKESLDKIGEKNTYKKHFYPDNRQIKIFIEGGSIVADLDTGSGFLEKITRRPVFHTVNYLHYNPGKWWTWASDIFAGALIIIAITGLFIIRGKNGITRRGAILTIAGIIAPLLFLYLFYW
ncbi:MAG: PepSY-associated TM helix domain-containing protein [Bacteroidales bacterium]